MVVRINEGTNMNSESGGSSARVLRTIIDQTPRAELLTCPICGFNFIHLLEVTAATGLDATVVDDTGTRVFRMNVGSSPQIDETFDQAVKKAVKESLKAAGERGVRLIIEYACENGGHHGNIILQFHKGNVVIQHEVLEDLKPEEWKDLWRT